MKASLILLCCCCWLASSEAGRFFDEVAKDIHDKVHDGAKKLGIFRQRDSATTTSSSPPPSSAKLSTLKTVDATSPDNRTFIGSIKRCGPTEVYAYGQCRSNE